MITGGLHLASAAQARIDDHVLDGAAALGERLVDRALQLDPYAPAPAAIRRDDHFCARVFDPVLDGIGGKSAENDRVNGTDTRTGVHRDHGLGNQRHVDDHAVALANAKGLEPVRQPGDLGVQLAVRQSADIARLPLGDDRDLVGAIRQIQVDAVV